MAFSIALVLVVQGLRAGFAGTDAVRFLDVGNEDLAITGVARTGRLHDGLNGFVQVDVSHYDGQHTPLDVAGLKNLSSDHLVFGGFAQAGNVPVGKPIDAGLIKGFFDIFKLGFSDNGFNFLHNE